MSAVSDQYNCERIMITILSQQTDLASLVTANAIVHQDNSTQLAGTSLDRIVVEAMPRTVFAYGYNQATPKIFSCMVKVTIVLAQNNPSLLDTYLAAIHAANTGSWPAAAVTERTSLFGSRGLDWFNTDDGERTAEDNQRTASCTWEARFGA